MNISRKWLKEFVDIHVSDKEYSDVLTMAGQKVETVTRMDAEIKNVVVAKVLSMARHQNSDHMRKFISRARQLPYKADSSVPFFRAARRGFLVR